MKDIATIKRDIDRRANCVVIDEGEDGIAIQFGQIRTIASWGGGWDHVSVSLPHRIPVWEEMCFIKEQFFHPEECVVQYHPRASQYVNNHPHCLHMWRKQGEPFPEPPSEFVGTRKGQDFLVINP